MLGPADINVLHVDDDPEVAELTADFLEREDERLNVETVSSAGEGLDELADTEYDCVVSDYQMPGQNGIEFLETVRDAHPDLPLVLYTGKGSEEVASEAISAGVTEYLQKETGTGQYAVLANRITNAVEAYRSRQAVVNTERKLSRLAENTDNVLFMVDGDWTELLFVNSAYEDIWDQSVDELEANPRSFLESVHPDDRERVDRTLERILDGHQTETEYRVRTDEGEVRWVHSEATPIFGADDTITRIVGFVRDITKRKRYEQQLEALHESIGRLVTADSREDIIQITAEASRNALSFPYVIVRLRNDNDELVPVWVSDETTEELGGQRPVYEPGEPTAGLAFSKQETVIYDDVQQFDDGIDRGDVRAVMYVPVGEHGVVTIADDEPGGFEQSTVNLAELFIGHVETAFDLVTRARELRRQNSRLEKVIGVIGHDLRNPLNVALGKLQLAREDADDERLGSAAAAVERSLELIDDLVELGRKDDNRDSMEPVELASVVEASWRSVETGDATRTVEADGAITADRSLLQELLENLIGNAVSHSRGAVSVTVGELDGGFYVADDGPGIDADERTRVFEPGYTTTETGTGMGLAIVQEIADIHDWDVRVTEGAGGGARFEITGVETE